MFDVDTSYPYYRVGTQSGITTNRKFVDHLIIYRFRSDLYPYLVEVEKYPYNIYAIKFYRRAHKEYKDKFNLLSDEGKCSRIVATCFSILLDIYKTNPLASFGFVGSNTINKLTNEVEDKEDTKRFRIYKQAVLNCFGEETFTHFQDVTNSTYLAISNKNKDVGMIISEAQKILGDLLS